MISIRTNSSTFRMLAALIVTAAALGPRTALAHDFWIEPSTFTPAPGQVVGMRLRVGDNLQGDSLPRDPKHVDQFVAEDATGRRSVYGRDGVDPAGLLRIERPGLVVVGYGSRPYLVALSAKKFNHYLEEEGLDAIAEIRARRHQSRAAARDLYSRHAKALIYSGGSESVGEDRPLGFTLELVAERNPYALAANEEFPVRLTYEGRPLAGALVVAMNQAAPGEKLSARTDDDGRVRFNLRPGGMWLIKAVHMVPAPSGSRADWRSYWASLTFSAGAPRT